MTASNPAHPLIIEIIEDAIRQIMATGTDSDTAASLMVLEAAMRIQDPAKRRVMATTLAELLKNPTH